MRTRKVDFRTYFSNEAREARRGLVQRRSASRFDGASGEADMARETDIEHRRRDAQIARDQRATRAALTKFVPIADELAKVRGGDSDAARRVARHANHSPNTQAEALCARFGLEDETDTAIESRQLLEEEAAQAKRQEEAAKWATLDGTPKEQVDDDVTRALRELKEEPRFFHDPRR
jgi:hypothetical protein